MTVSMLCVSGCKEKSGERRYDTKLGTAKAINVQTGEVVLEIMTKKGEKKEIPGWVRQETEIIINGKVAKLEDVKPMEEVKVTGYIEGEGLSQQYVATRVEILRPEEMTLGGGEAAPPDHATDSENDAEAPAAKEETATSDEAPEPE
jgi:hypothetical protein